MGKPYLLSDLFHKPDHIANLMIQPNLEWHNNAASFSIDVTESNWEHFSWRRKNEIVRILKMCGWSESAIVQGDNILGRVEQTKIIQIIRFNYEWNWDSYFLNYVDILHLRCFGWYDSVQQVWNSKNNFHANTERWRWYLFLYQLHPSEASECIV